MVYDKSIKTKYVLVVMSSIIDGGDDAEALLSKHDLSFAGGAVKPFRYHEFIDGIPDSIFRDEHCKHCKHTRQVKNRNLHHACPYPERGDVDIEIVSYHPPHTKDKCCTEHGHHADTMHINCFLR